MTAQGAVVESCGTHAAHQESPPHAGAGVVQERTTTSERQRAQRRGQAARTALERAPDLPLQPPARRRSACSPQMKEPAEASSVHSAPSVRSQRRVADLAMSQVSSSRPCWTRTRMRVRTAPRPRSAVKGGRSGRAPTRRQSAAKETKGGSSAGPWLRCRAQFLVRSQRRPSSSRSEEGPRPPVRRKAMRDAARGAARGHRGAPRRPKSVPMEEYTHQGAQEQPRAVRKHRISTRCCAGPGKAT